MTGSVQVHLLPYPTPAEVLEATGMPSEQAEMEAERMGSAELALREAAKNESSEKIQKLVRNNIFYPADFAQAMCAAAEANRFTNFWILKNSGGYLSLENLSRAFYASLDKGEIEMLGELIEEAKSSCSLDGLVDRIPAENRLRVLNRLIDLKLQALGERARYWREVGKGLDPMIQQLKEKRSR